MSTTSSIMGSALSNAQIAIRTISNNILNAATEGYSRQRVSLSTRQVVNSGSNIWLGSGASIDGIQSMQNRLLNDQVNLSTSAAQKSDSYATNFSQLDTLVSNLENSLSTTMGEFTASASALASDPTASSNRDRFMAASSGVAARYQEISSQLDNLAVALNRQVEQATNDINSYAQQIARINKSSSADSNDLNDERERLVSKISEQISVRVLRNNQGAVDVFLPNGQQLVVNDKTYALVTYQNQDDPTHVEVGFDNQGGNPTPLGQGALTGGALAGISAFRQDGLQSVQNELGRMAMAFADAANAAHKMGQTSEGVEGGDLFTYNQPTVHDYLSNTGTAKLSAKVTDSTKITTQTYGISYDGSNWNVTRSDGTKSTFTSMPVALDGFELSVDSGRVAAGDMFTIDPARSGSDSLRFNLNSPKEIASGYPVMVSDASGNSGYAKALTIQPTSSPWNAAIKTAVDVVATAPGTFTINGHAPTRTTRTTEGWQVEYNGWALSISGTPASGDTFKVRPSSGKGDGRNADALTALSKARIVGGEFTVSAAYSRLVNSIGSKTAVAQTSLQASEAIATKAQTARDNVSGVNLDEEASELMRWQQMYQAALKVTQTTDRLLDSLFAALG